MKKTKIVCTIGPASSKPAVIEKLIKNGMNVARLNFSHGSHEEKLVTLKTIREYAKKLKAPVAIQQELQGPRFRIGDVGDGININKGEKLSLFYEKNSSKIKRSSAIKYIPIQSRDLYKSFKTGDSILIDEGLISLKVLSVKKDGQIITKVLVGGFAKTNKGMNFPGVNLKMSALTEKDKKDVRWGIKNKVDFIAFSFVRTADDVEELRKLIKQLEIKRKKENKLCKNCPVKEWQTTCTHIISKIETVQSVENFDEILKVSDGIMVARGDLGIELSPQQVPLLQKEIVAECNMAGKPVIVATQMLESMTKNPIPTRAEASDVANAILDGTDAVMLSAESAAGKYPVGSVKVLSKIADEVENSTTNKDRNYLALPTHCLQDTVEAVSLAVYHMSKQINADVIVCATTSGFTARTIARYKPETPIIALTDVYKTKIQLSMSWGVESHLVPNSFCECLDTFVSKSVEFLKNRKMVKKGDKIIFAMSHPFNLIGDTNSIKVHIVE